MVIPPITIRKIFNNSLLSGRLALFFQSDLHWSQHSGHCLFEGSSAGILTWSLFGSCSSSPFNLLNLFPFPFFPHLSTFKPIKIADMKLFDRNFSAVFDLE